MISSYQAAKELALSQGRGFGEEVSRLSQSQYILEQSVELVRKYNLNRTLADMANSLLQTVIATKTKVEYELRTIYMENAPSYSSLPPVGAVSLVKPTPIPESTISEEPLLKTLLPKSVIDVLSSLQDRYRHFNI